MRTEQPVPQQGGIALDPGVLLFVVFTVVFFAGVLRHLRPATNAKIAVLVGAALTAGLLTLFAGQLPLALIYAVPAAGAAFAIFAFAERKS